MLQSRLLMVEGKLQIEGEVIHVVVHKGFNLTGLLKDLTKTEKDHIPVLTLPEADETSAPVAAGREVFHKGRNFK